MAGKRAFKRAGTVVLPFSELSTVVASGPFAFTGKPMYQGLVLCLLGWTVLLDSVAPFIVVPAFFALIHFRVVRCEEPFMAAAGPIESSAAAPVEEIIARSRATKA
jgi:protein-S-isoprenylcysteine O-methyltransferase Ste14